MINDQDANVQSTVVNPALASPPSAHTSLPRCLTSHQLLFPTSSLSPPTSSIPSQRQRLPPPQLLPSRASFTSCNTTPHPQPTTFSLVVSFSTTDWKEAESQMFPLVNAISMPCTIFSPEQVPPKRPILASTTRPLPAPRVGSTLVTPPSSRSVSMMPMASSFSRQPSRSSSSLATILPRFARCLLLFSTSAS